ncbi:MAG: GNAT family protein [bacterium]|nr:GNAT family protein [bacterium]
MKAAVFHLLVDWAFGALNLHRLAVGVVALNTSALLLWEKVGFRREGVWRDGYFCKHEFNDFVIMSLLEDEFRSARENAAGPPG